MLFCACGASLTVQALCVNTLVDVYHTDSIFDGLGFALVLSSKVLLLSEKYLLTQ